MQKIFYVLFFSCFGSLLSAQCMPDSSILATGDLVAPPPVPVDSATSLNLACLTEPYTQTITLATPDTFTLSGFTAALDRVEIALTGAVTNLPAGLNYSCNPPNCVFENGTLGCILLSGTPTSPAGIYELGITLRVYPQGIPFPIDVAFPSQVAPDLRYYLEVRAANQCNVGTNDLASQIGTLRSAPNPFGQQTEIQIESNTNGLFTFEVFNLVGQRVYAEPIRLAEGFNQFTFDAGDMANGTYFYSIGNAEGRATRTFVIQR
jgi:hypothetical protein